MVGRALATAPASAGSLELRAGDWLLAALLASFPVVGVVLGPGHILSLAGLGILIWVGHRAPVSPAIRDAYRAAAVAALLVVLCLCLPQLSSTPTGWLPASVFGLAIRIGLVAAGVLALWRKPERVRPWMRTTDRATLLALLGAGGLALILRAPGAPLHTLESIFLCALVYVIYRSQLLGSSALPLLTRTSLYGVAGALAVAVLG